MSSANITLEEILVRKIQFVMADLQELDPDDFDNDPYSLSYDEYKVQCEGELRAYREMLTAISLGISEVDFVNRFLDKMEEYERASRSSGSDEKIIDINTGIAKGELERLEHGAYSAAAKEILNLFLPVYTDEDFE